MRGAEEGRCGAGGRRKGEEEEEESESRIWGNRGNIVLGRLTYYMNLEAFRKTKVLDLAERV